MPRSPSTIAPWTSARTWRLTLFPVWRGMPTSSYAPRRPLPQGPRSPAAQSTTRWPSSCFSTETWPGTWAPTKSSANWHRRMAMTVYPIDGIPLFSDYSLRFWEIVYSQEIVDKFCRNRLGMFYLFVCFLCVDLLFIFKPQIYRFWSVFLKLFGCLI